MLAAGRGSRLRPLTDTQPKPLITVGGKPILFHILDALPASVDRITIVVGYLGEMIEGAVGSSYRNIPVEYVVQTRLDGTGAALELCQDRIDAPTLVVNADDIYAKQDLLRITQFPLAVLAQLTRESVASPFEVSSENLLRGFIPKGDIVPGAEHWQNCGAYMVDKRYFSIEGIEVPIRDQHPELSLPHTLAALAASEKVHVVEATSWTPIGTPEELARAVHNFPSRC